jgi:hypothetical protein
MLRAPRPVIALPSSSRLASALFNLLHTRESPLPHRSAVAAAAAAHGSTGGGHSSSRRRRSPLPLLLPSRPMASDAAAPAPGARAWEDVLNELSDLITFKTRADGKGWRDAFENMPVYLDVESFFVSLFRGRRERFLFFFARRRRRRPNSRPFCSSHIHTNTKHQNTAPRHQGGHPEAERDPRRGHQGQGERERERERRDGNE